MKQDYLDVIVVGAGISGIGAGAHLNTKCPDKTYAIFEGRDNFGGTWDLFKYPGIRSDSDMHTLGFSFKPWNHKKSIASGPLIMEYLQETIEEYGLNEKIKYNHHVESANWNEADGLWEVSITEKKSSEKFLYKSKFLYMCAGYYRYSSGYEPEFKGSENFSGQIIHPQKWPESLDYSGKNVVVIGSGATAATIVPEIAKEANLVTMLQRSPTYFVSRPDEDRIALFLKKFLPKSFVYALIRFKNVYIQQSIFKRVRAFPIKSKKFLIDQVKKELPDFDVDKHFTPSYNPWEQRMCLVPNSDFFNAIKDKSATVVTDHIESFEEKGIKLKSGEFLDADIIVTATGLVLQNFGGVTISVNNNPVNVSKTMTYKSLMYSDIPNFVNSFGYINASWTLKADLTSTYLCRLIKHMDKNEYLSACPRKPLDVDETYDWLKDFSSGYIQRSLDLHPQQGSKKPWVNYQDYIKDWIDVKFSKLEDGNLIFSKD